MSEPVFKKRKPYVARAEEDDRYGEPDFKAVLVESVDRELEPEQYVVQDTDRDRGRDTIYREQNSQRPLRAR